MEITHLSSEGHVVIPEVLRALHHWEAGQELVVIDTNDGILLRSRKPFPKTRLEDVAGCLQYQGVPKTLNEIEEAMRKGFIEDSRDGYARLEKPDDCS